MNGGDIAARVDGLAPLHMEPVNVVVQLLNGAVPPEEMPEVLAELENMTDEIVTHARCVQATVKGVLACTPQAATCIPTGF
ncbi:MAG: hypothetical protein M0R37_11790 [Bacteroidales bacterium]|jgi:hypothetical protein|nr:hypothetical protein [Bacteroidales bacterium]